LPAPDYGATDLVSGEAVPAAKPLKLAKRIGAKDVWVVRLTPK
jgi:hypothetical protein